MMCRDSYDVCLYVRPFLVVIGILWLVFRDVAYMTLVCMSVRIWLSAGFPSWYGVIY